MRLSVRAQVMLILGIMWICRGLLIVHDPGSGLSDNAVSYLAWPVWVRVAIWSGSGLLAVAFAFTGPKWGVFGWVAVVFAPAERAILHAAGIVMWVLSDGTRATLWDAVHAILWSGYPVLIWLLIRHLPTPQEQSALAHVDRDGQDA